MINIDNAKEEFIRYRNLFDKDNANIERKYIHTINVMNLSETIAKSLNLNEEEIKLAKLIALLHDIARFEEYKGVKNETTFVNFETYDHASRGVEILKENNFIRKFIQENKYDDIIYAAIRNHNKNKIEDNLTEEKILYCRILRDADKLDILRLSATTYWKNETEKVETAIINKKMLTEFCNHHTIDTTKITENTQLDKLVKVIAFIYDLQYKKSFEILKEKDYFNKIIDRFDFKENQTKQSILDMKKIGNEFINSKI